ncbi:MAG: hypothetical protein AAGI07_12185 [Bacteroidota bacterium]
MENQEIFRLPAGVSGFYKEDEPTPSAVDVNQFRKACEQLAEQSGYTLHTFYDFSASKTKSYHLAILAKDTESYIMVFCNRYYPIVAFSRVLEIEKIAQADLSLPENTFFDDDQIAAFFKEDFTVLASDYLSITVDADNEADALAVEKLTFYEFAEFSFWKPQLLAEIIFNNWG